MILKRLQDKAPNYNVQKWCQEDDKRRQMLGQICEYPYQLHEKPQANTSFSGTQSQTQVGPHASHYGSQSRKGNTAHSAGFGQQSRGRKFNAMAPSAVKKQTLHTGEYDLGVGSPYAVEVSITVKE